MLTPNVVPDFTGLRVAVVGDLIADHYLFASPSRLSREAPVLVLRHEREEIRGGGSANVARNLWSLGAQTHVIGAVGRDANGRELRSLLETESITVEDVLTIPGWVTPTKTRILGAGPRRTMQQLLRIDHDPDAPLPQDARFKIADRVRALSGVVDAVILSDYDYGAVRQEVAEAARELMRDGIIVVLDPGRQVDGFRGLSAITPNLTELAEMADMPPSAMDSAPKVREAAQRVVDRLAPEFCLVTMGNQGMRLFGSSLPDEGVWLAASGGNEVIDVSGAGDTAVAAFTLALTAGLGVEGAMRIANVASGVVVMENGTAVCQLSKLRSALPHAPRPSPIATATSPG